MMKKIIIMIVTITVVLVVAGVVGVRFFVEDKPTAEEIEAEITQADEKADANSQKAQQLVSQVSNTKVETANADVNAECTITCSGDEAQIEGSGAEYKEGVLSITKAGIYEITGELTDGRIEVNATSEDKVQIILNGVDVICSDYAPFTVWQADETIVTLADGTTNTFIDGGSYYMADSQSDSSADASIKKSGESDRDETPSAAFYSKDDLTFAGNGTLVINASCNDGITGKDDVCFQGGTYEITASDDGIIGKDSLVIQDGKFVIEADGDGVKATEDTDAEKGFVSISGGKLDITCEKDAIQAVTYVWIDGGEYKLETGGGAGAVTSNTGMMDKRGYTTDTESDDTGSCKGIKAGVDITINNGTFVVDCFDDTIHSNDTITITDGTFFMKAGDDGIHGDTAVVIAGGDVTVEQSYEGIEAETIVIKGGNVLVTASDDGLNAANGESEEGMDGPWGGGPQAEGSASGTLSIEGGKLYVDAGGDGLDSNGSISMSGGEVLVDGPTNSGNGILDYNSEFIITGGTLAGAGSSGMMQGTSSNSTQGGMAIALGNSYEAGSEVVITDSNGNEVISYTPSKIFSAIIVSCDELEIGKTYTVSVGGSKIETVELASVSVSNGSSGMGGGNPGGDMGGRGGQRMR